MMAKILLLCIAQAVFVQHISCQCIGYNGYTAEFAGPYGAGPYGAGPYGPGPCGPGPYGAGPYAAGPYAAGPCAAEWGVGYNPAALAASHGPGLAVTSASPVPPTGVTTVSETALSGELIVAGQVPFLSSVGLEGALPTVGAGAITYGCGNGAVAILNEEIGPITYGGLGAPFEYAAGPYGPYGVGPVAAGPAYGFGPGYGCGCGGIY